MNYDPMYGYNKLKGMMDDPQFRQDPEAMLRSVPPAMLSTIVGALFPQAGRMFSGGMGQMGQQFPDFMSFFGPPQAQQLPGQKIGSMPGYEGARVQGPNDGLAPGNFGKESMPGYEGARTQGPSDGLALGQKIGSMPGYEGARTQGLGDGLAPGNFGGRPRGLGGLGGLGGMRSGNAMARQFNRRSSYGG